MTNSPIIATYSRASFGHAPSFEVSQSGIEPCVETPTRLTHVLDELSRVEKVGIVPAEQNCDSSIWERVHSTELLGELGALSARAVRAGEYVYPYPVRFLAACPEDARRMLHAHGVASTRVSDIAAPVGPDTWKACEANSRMILDGVEMLRSKETALVMALTRPPGHHAGRDFFGSFCYLNSAALAGSLLNEHSQKVAILDVDFHHGNGTQDIFSDSRSVRCASIHENQDGLNEWYPFKGQSHVVGAYGAIINIPLASGAAESEWLDGVESGLTRAVNSDAGYLVLALGFDAYQRDPFSRFLLQIDTYRKLGQKIARLGIPTLVTLEGGYAIDELGKLSRAFVEGFQGL